MKILLILEIHFNTQTEIKWNSDDAKESYELFQSTLISLFNYHFPLQTKNINNKADRKPWITPGILTYILAKRRREKSTK